MFHRFANILHSAVEALAPSLSLQQDFIAHWKAITTYFVDSKDNKAPIESTNIPTHLDHMLTVLIQEEMSCESGSTGPCMEYMLHHKLLETLYTLGRTDHPPGMKQQVLIFFTKLLSKIKQPLLPHVSVHRAVIRLIRVCGEVQAGPTENEEVHFLCTVCGKLKSDPYLVNFFIESQKSRAKTQRPPAGSGNGKKTGSEFSLVESLLSLSKSEDGRVAVKSCEGLILCASLPEQASASCLVNNTNFCKEMITKLCHLYEKLPKLIDPTDLETVEAKWGLDMHMNEFDPSRNFPGKRQLISLLSWLDFLDQMIYVADPVVGSKLAEHFKADFLDAIILPAVLQTSESGAITATAFLTKCLKLVSSPRLLQEFAVFILGEGTRPENPGEEDKHKLRHQLMKRCDHLSEELTITTLKLFEMLLLKANEHIFKNLLLRNLLYRDYRTSEVGSNDSVSSETKEPESTSMPRQDSMDSDTLISSGDHSLTEMESPIHKIVNSFLVLVPDDVKSSYQCADSGYDTYLRDAHKQFSDCVLQCSEFKWPKQPVAEEAYKRDSFYEGSFLKILFDKLSRMLDQSYEINLQVTSVVSKLALLPHPNLNEYLLNPVLPSGEGCRTLHKIFQKVVHDIYSRAKSTDNFKHQLVDARKKLLGIGEIINRGENHSTLEGVIVLEEFCKELAAIAFVKQHDMVSDSRH
ncbi:FHF complex subunit HOOK interacting protein 2A-like isoform X2 [Lineus longissimus]|uniref:FHF complex subunit HOOK interacting protein 2A-like isoform X2 n=1 Tax=Lineus longissimus TaxID=88925 RepID=UPI002B4D51DB